MTLELGDYCKFYETIETEKKLFPTLPVYARLDGINFSKFTKNCKKPFDIRLSATMIGLTEFLVKRFNASCGYTQSDEISLGWGRNREIPFNRKIQKLTSSMAGLASSYFEKYQNKINVEQLPSFDCRVFALPTEEDVAKQFLWRERDCTKNAITMAAQQLYSHKELLNKKSNDKQEMMFQKGTNFNDYPAFFKRGTFVIRRTVEEVLSQEILNKIPENKRPENNTRFKRNVISTINLPSFGSIINKCEVLLYGQEPMLYGNENNETTTSPFS